MIFKVLDNSPVKALNENIYTCWFGGFLPLRAEKKRRVSE